MNGSVPVHCCKCAAVNVRNVMLWPSLYMYIVLLSVSSLLWWLWLASVCLLYEMWFVC